MEENVADVHLDSVAMEPIATICLEHGEENKARCNGILAVKPQIQLPWSQQSGSVRGTEK